MTDLIFYPGPKQQTRDLSAQSSGASIIRIKKGTPESRHKGWAMIAHFFFLLNSADKPFVAVSRIGSNRTAMLRCSVYNPTLFVCIRRDTLCGIPFLLCVTCECFTGILLFGWQYTGPTFPILVAVLPQEPQRCSQFYVASPVCGLIIEIPSKHIAPHGFPYHCQ
jgi:hypothetical protein